MNPEGSIEDTVLVPSTPHLPSSQRPSATDEHIQKLLKEHHILGAITYNQSNEKKVPVLNPTQRKILASYFVETEIADISQTTIEQIRTEIDEKIHLLQSQQTQTDKTPEPPPPPGTSEQMPIKSIEELTQSLPPEFQNAFAQIAEQVRSPSNTLQMLYFLTQPGPTRREDGGLIEEGDIAHPHKLLNGVNRRLGLLNNYLDLSDFYRQLSQEDKEKYRETFQELFENLEKALLSAVLSQGLLVFGNSILPNLCSSIHQEIQALQPGKSWLFSGGYSKENSGHTVLYKITKEADQTFTFTIYNTGDGLKYHPQIGLKKANICIRNITSEQLNERYLSDLLTCIIPNPENNIERLYNILGSLGPFEATSTPHYDQGGIGSCSYTPLLRYEKETLRTTGEPDLFLRFHTFCIQKHLREAQSSSVLARDEIPFEQYTIQKGTVPQTTVTRLKQSAELTVNRRSRWAKIQEKLSSSTLSEENLRSIQDIVTEILISPLEENEKKYDLRKLFQWLAEKNPELAQILLMQYPNDSLQYIAGVNALSKIFLEQQERQKASTEAKKLPETVQTRALSRIELARAPSEIIERLLELTNGISNPIQKSEALINIVQMLYSQKNYDKALEIAQQIPDTIIQSRAFLRIITAYILEHKVDEAVNITKRIQTPGLKTIAYMKIHDMYLADHQPEKAQEIATFVPDFGDQKSAFIQAFEFNDWNITVKKLLEISKQLLRTNHPQAALKVSQMIECGHLRDELLLDIAKALPETTPVGEYLLVVDEMVDRHYQTSAITHMCTVLYKLEKPKQAIELFDTLPDEDKDLALHHICTELAKVGKCTEALRLLDKHSDTSFKTMVINDMYLELFNLNKNDEALLLIEALPNDHIKNTAIVSICLKVAEYGTIDETCQLISKIQNTSDRTKALSRIGLDLSRLYLSDKAWKLIDTMPNAEEKKQVVESICITLVKNGQIEQTWDLINEMPSTYQKNTFIKNIYIALTQSDQLDAAQALIDTMSEGEDKNQVLKELSNEMSRLQSK